MNWGIEDLVAAAAILIGVGIGIAVVFRAVRAQPARGILSACVILVALAVWAHLAVGIF